MIKYSDVISLYNSDYHANKALEKYKYLFPVRWNKELAEIVGALIGDGHLQGKPNWRFDFASNDLEEIRRFEYVLYGIFHIKGKSRKVTTNKYGTVLYGVNNKPISRVLFLSGVPYGNKVLKKFSVPEWILKDKNFFKSFIKRLLDCEGIVDTKNKYVELQMWKASRLHKDGIEFFEQIKYGLKYYFDIETTNVFSGNSYNIRKDGIKTQPFRIKIKRRDAVKRFYENIGFGNRIKQKKLETVISSIGLGR